MAERPVPFSAPMVRAILAGTKTQTRRVVKITHRTPGLAACLQPADPTWARTKAAAELCPYGRPGDRLWVREATLKVEDAGWVGPVFVESDAGRNALEWGYGESDDPDFIEPYELKTRPPMFMPRKYSRITLEIVSVRVERLQDISEDDAKAEGAWGPDESIVGKVAEHFGRDPLSVHPSLAYRMVWEQINGGGSWDANPWVWVIEFKRVDAGAA